MESPLASEAVKLHDAKVRTKVKARRPRRRRRSTGGMRTWNVSLDGAVEWYLWDDAVSHINWTDEQSFTCMHIHIITRLILYTDHGVLSLTLHALRGHVGDPILLGGLNACETAVTVDSRKSPAEVV